MDGIPKFKDMNLGKFPEVLKERKSWHAAVHGVAKSQNKLSN